MLGAPASNLTMRELQVARLIDEGLSNKQIALELEIELSTVKHHVHHILEKLEVARRSEAVARLRQRGLLQGWRSGRRVGEGLGPLGALHHGLDRKIYCGVIGSRATLDRGGRAGSRDPGRGSKSVRVNERVWE